MRLIAISTVAVALVGCATPISLVKVDGSMPPAAEIKQAFAICNGAAVTGVPSLPRPSYAPSLAIVNSTIYAGRQQGVPAIDSAGPLGDLGDTIATNMARKQAFLGCMAQLGYIEASSQ